eukprot:7066541-Alexandrium_andersonii.AAC.1
MVDTRAAMRLGTRAASGPQPSDRHRTCAAGAHPGPRYAGSGHRRTSALATGILAPWPQGALR